jgi:hypothetical protein
MRRPFLERQNLSSVQSQAGPVGIGGWLILPILQLCGTILRILWYFGDLVREWKYTQAIIAGGDSGLDAMRLLLTVSATLSVAAVVVAALCLYGIFARSPTVPRIMTVFYIGAVLAILGKSLLSHFLFEGGVAGALMDSDNFFDMICVMAVAAIWIPYFHCSKRVANTFRI